MATVNPFDQFDKPAAPQGTQEANPFDQFDPPVETPLDVAPPVPRSEFGPELSGTTPMGKRLIEGRYPVRRQEFDFVPELTRKAAAQKESLEALVERMGGLESMEDPSRANCSLLSSNSKFDPILFLTLVHRKTSYDALMGSMGRLSSK